jgi:putative membrane-bound dehydrogenase-like protein
VTLLRCVFAIALVLAAVPEIGSAEPPSAKSLDRTSSPVPTDPRLVVERFAASPDVVHPIATDFDARGRLLVVESHTHFRPPKYDGPKHDRIRVLEDTDGDGKADRFTTFFEGTTHTMDVAVHPDGSVYVATRNEILRLRDSDGDGKADEKTRIAFLDTVGNYPHNGLCGLTFDSRGDLYFGMGENLGAAYKLIAADGTTIAGGGEGGNVFWCTADGKKLRRVATGFWNPFGACRDIYGRLFVVDNDPDSSPPCRLLHVVEGGDYGFQFRYGRAGRHPFQAWNGELPGTLPYAAGTGESPCEVISYESDRLPTEYLGNLLVPAWADHRVERYIPRANGASISADRKLFIQGGNDFYPSGLSVAPDGSLFVTDWGSKSYELHGKGAVWHVRWKDAKPPPRPTDPKQALTSSHRPTREAAARSLARDEAGRAALREHLSVGDARTRAFALTALIDAGDTKVDLLAIAKTDKEIGLREMAVRALAKRGADVTAFANEDAAPTVRAEALAGLEGDAAIGLLPKFLADPDPFLRHAAVQKLARSPELLAKIDHRTLTDARQRLGVLLALHASGVKYAQLLIADFLKDPDPDVRFLAVKWISDERRVEYRPHLREAIKNPSLDHRGFVGLATALARLDDQPVNDDALADFFQNRLTDKSAPVSVRIMALRAIPATYAKLKTDQVTELLGHDDAGFRVEVLRALKDRADRKAAAKVRDLARDNRQPVAVRAQTLVTLAALNLSDTDFLIGLAGGDDRALRQEAIRSLYSIKLTTDQRTALESATRGKDDCTDLVARVLGKPFHVNRPLATDTAAWLKHLDGPADPEAGRRVFEHPKVATCAKCHRVDGRGTDIGPDLSLVGRTDRRWIVESILQPSAAVAPHYQPWKVDTLDGRSRIGQLIRTYLDECTYIDAKGEPFKVTAAEVAEATPTRGSIMPDGLVDTLTDQEIRDLVAYLALRK